MGQINTIKELISNLKHGFYELSDEEICNEPAGLYSEY
jgi:hypothetical protein